MARFKKFSKNSLLVFASVCFTLLLIELYFRIFNPQQLIILDSSAVWIPRDTIGWENMPNCNEKVNTGEKTITFKTDHFGYRITEKTNQKHFKKILFVGDSYLQAIQVEANNIFCHKLSRSLSKEKLPIHYTNTGSIGYDPNQYFIALKKALHREEFDMAVVSIYLPNDCIDSTYDYRQAIPQQRLNDTRIGNPFSLANFGVNVIRPLNEIAERNSHLYIYFKPKFKGLFAQFSSNVKYVHAPFLANDPSKNRWQNVHQMFAKIQNECDKKNLPCLFVLIPAKYQIDENLWQQQLNADGLTKNDADINLPNKKINEWKNEFHMLDLKSAIVKSGQPCYGKVDVHFNESGHAITAKEIKKYIDQNFSDVFSENIINNPH